MARPIIIAAVALALAGTARAQGVNQGLDTVPQKPSALQGGLLTLEGARTPTPRSFRLATALDLNHQILALKLGDEKIGDLVEWRLDMHLLGSWAVLRWLQIGADVPFTLWQDSGLALLAERTGLPEPRIASFAAGDMRLLAKARLLEEGPGPLGIALIAELRLPTGEEESFLGERGPVLGGKLALERSLGPVRLAGELGYRVRDRPGRALNLFIGDEVTFGGGAAVRVTEDEAAWTITGEVVGSTPASDPFAGGDALISPLEALLGVGAGIPDGPRFTVGVGRGLSSTTGYGREALRVFAVVAWERDLDDADLDGVDDAVDACPDVPEDRDGVEDCDGCPEEDADSDGLADAVDRCPARPGPKEYDGCPDRDKDQIPDVEDACPDQPGVAKRNGCPEGPAAELRDGRVEFEGAVNFDTGQATLEARSLPVLDAVARVLREHPEVTRLRVVGHTDSVGSAADNRELSRRRAQAVVEYLVAHGVEPERLVATGKGEDEPVATNETALGRAKNRRVEFEVMETR